MRIARVIGTVTLNQQLPDLKPGQFVVAEALDGAALVGLDEHARRARPMPESLIVFDQLGAGLGQIIGVSEGREACAPFWPEKVPLDAYCAAILDNVEYGEEGSAK